MYIDHIYTILNNALDYGISEHDFWEMTIAELNRQVDSKKRIAKLEAKEQASSNYIHAILVGRVVLSAFDSNVTVPKIHEVYPALFQENKVAEEKLAEQQDLLSALRFKQFAQSFNEKYYKEEANDK